MDDQIDLVILEMKVGSSMILESQTVSSHLQHRQQDSLLAAENDVCLIIPGMWKAIAFVFYAPQTNNIPSDVKNLYEKENLNSEASGCK